MQRWVCSHLSPSSVVSPQLVCLNCHHPRFLCRLACLSPTLCNVNNFCHQPSVHNLTHPTLLSAAGARLRYPPENQWPINAELDRTLEVLAPIKAKYGDALSWADLIVLAGNTALEVSGSPQLKFCGGRTDASDGLGSEYLAPRVSGNASDPIALVKDTFTVRLEMRLLDSPLSPFPPPCVQLQLHFARSLLPLPLFPLMGPRQLQCVLVDPGMNRLL